MQVEDRIKEFRRVPASELKPNPKNWREHPEAQRKTLRELLERIGFAGAALARELDDGTLELIDGHERCELMSEQDVPTLILDLNEEEADLLLATFDPVTQMASTNAAAMHALVADAAAAGQYTLQLLEDMKDANPLEQAAAGSNAGQRETLLDQAVQLKPPREYVVIMCEDAEDFEQLKAALNLEPVRRGGYKEGSPFDHVGTQRVVPAKLLLARLAEC